MTKWVRFLIIANVVIFFAQNTIDGFTSAFMFSPETALTRPWTAVTYMFLHGGFAHILFNMLGLYFLGSRVEDRLGPQRFLTLYFISGISAAIASFFLARYAAVIGASGGLFGVMLAYAWFWPREKLLIYGIIPVEARVLVFGYALFSIFAGYGGVGGNTAHFAHLGGLAGGFLYLKWISTHQGAKKFRTMATPKVPEQRLVNWKSVDPRSVHEVNRDELNRVLDKVSKSGIESLTPDERRFLMSFVPRDDRPPMVS